MEKFTFVVDVDELEVDEGVVDVVVEENVYFVADPVLPSERRGVEDTLDASVQAICKPCAGRRSGRHTSRNVWPRFCHVTK